MKQRSASLDWWETCIPIDTSGARVSTSAWNTQVVRIADIGQVAGCSFRPFDFRSSRFFSPSTGSDPRFKKAGCGIQFVNRAENFANSQPKFVLSGSLTLLPLLPSSRFHLCLISPIILFVRLDTNSSVVDFVLFLINSRVKKLLGKLYIYLE